MRTSFILTLIILVVASCSSPESNEETINFPEASIAPDWTRNASIYEVNIRQHTPEGTINAFSSHLPEIKALGTDILWLMPIFPVGEKFRKATQNTLIEEIEDPEERKKYLGSPYAIKDYKAVNPDFGTDHDFRAFVQKAHDLGMKVILDIAANHSAWDHEWITSHPEYYSKIAPGTTPWNPDWMSQHPEFYAELTERGLTYPIDEGETDWWDTAELNYDNADLRAEMIDILKYWVEEFNVDGYRCDVAMQVPTDFWEEARKELDKQKPLFMLAEAEQIDHLNYAFDMNYGWELHHIMNNIAKGEMNVNNLTEYLAKYKTQYGPDAYRMNFITNHDENSWNGTLNERMGDAQLAMAGLMATLPGMPLIYSGQEAGLDKRLRFFEKDTIDWQESELRSFYTSLLQQKKINKALWNGEAGGELNILNTNQAETIFAISREKDGDKILAVFNFSNEATQFEFSQPINVSGLQDLFINGSEEKLSTKSVSMGPWEYIILTSKR